MPKFTLPVSWTMVANVEVEADSLDDAIEKATYESTLPSEAEYLSDSFQVDTDLMVNDQEEE